MVGYIILAIVIVALVGFIISKYNSLVRFRNNAQNAFAQIETHLQRRFDLIPNLVETVKGYQIHERDLLEHIAAYRSGFLGASTNGEKLAISNQLSTDLRSLLAVVENYPDLKANTNFLMLQNELADTENKIVYARQFYNDAVTIYNSSLQIFPNNIIASVFNFTEETLYSSVPEAYEAPQVRF